MRDWIETLGRNLFDVGGCFATGPRGPRWTRHEKRRPGKDADFAARMEWHLRDIAEDRRVHNLRHSAWLCERAIERGEGEPWVARLALLDKLINDAEGR